jgi:hypothetical protein
MQSSHGYVMPCSTWLTKRMHRWKLLIIRLRLWEVRTVDSIASSYFQCFGKSVGQYQGLPPHSDEYKTLEKSWLSYACHAMREGLPGFWSLPYLSPAIQNAVPELAPSQQTASTERIDPCLALVARAQRRIPIGLPHAMKRRSTNCAVSWKPNLTVLAISPTVRKTNCQYLRAIDQTRKVADNSKHFKHYY